jgi:hypothetical protein
MAVRNNHRTYDIILSGFNPLLQSVASRCAHTCVVCVCRFRGVRSCSP